MKYIIHRENELKHYGVPGTKWGVRRYQNKDGSYKPGAEGRYYDAVKKGSLVLKNAVAKASGIRGTITRVGPGGTTMSSAQSKSQKTKIEKKLERGTGQSPDTTNKSTHEQSAGGSAQTASRPINKTIDGKDINVKDVSEKIDTSKSDSKSSNSKKASKKKATTGKSASTSTKAFKVSELTDKIENFFDLDNMTDQDWEEMELSDSDISELDDLISKYKQWRASNNSNTKKLKKIDEFIERYEAWKSSRSKHSEPREEYLQHFGILGMKWGIRRYQNKDGSYKSGAEGRYAQNKTTGRKITPSEDYVKSRSKSRQEMSDDELKATVQRLNNEQQYENYLKSLEPQDKATLADKKVTNKESDDSKNAKKHDGKTLTNDELQEAIQRLEREKRYRDLKAEMQGPIGKAVDKMVSSVWNSAVDGITKKISSSISDIVTGEASQRAAKNAMESAGRKVKSGLEQINDQRKRLRK